MAKKSDNDRRKRINDIKAQQKRAERRTTYIFVAVAALLAGGLIAGAVVFGGAGGEGIALDTLGATRDEAKCGEVEVASSEISGQHVGPGATSPELQSRTFVQYSTTPPTGGDHYLQTAPPNKNFYDRDDEIQPERLVHNLEHGYIVVWYDKQAGDDEVDLLRQISKNVRKVNDRFGKKFIVAPYDRGEFEGDTNIGITAWGALQRCEKVSGEAIEAFIDDFRAPGGPKAKAPEPNAG